MILMSSRSMHKPLRCLLRVDKRVTLLCNAPRSVAFDLKLTLVPQPDQTSPANVTTKSIIISDIILTHLMCGIPTPP